MASPIIHPRLLSSLGSFYASLVTIEQDAGTTTNAVGEAIPDWQPIKELTALACSIAPERAASISSSERRTDKQTVTTNVYHIAIQSYQPTIQPIMHAVANGVTYSILAVEHDSHRTMTRLRCEIVKGI